jgi:hypothetical protein
MKIRKYKIYVLKCPISDEIRYVGVTIGTLNGRLSHHIYTANNNKTTYCAKWIYSLLKINKRPVIELVEECEKEQWEERERFYIKYYKLTGCNLTNIKEGGTGSIVCRNKNGIQRSIEAHEKRVYLFNKDFSLFKVFESQIKCADYLNCHSSAIGKVLLNIVQTLKGYYVCDDSYYEEYLRTSNINYIKRMEYLPPKCATPITFKCKITGKISKFFSIASASKSLNIPYYILKRFISKTEYKPETAINLYFCLHEDIV